MQDFRYRRQGVVDPWGGTKDALSFYANQKRFEQRMSLQERGLELQKQQADNAMLYSRMQEQRAREVHEDQKKIRDMKWFQGKLQYETARLPEDSKNYSRWYADATGPDPKFGDAEIPSKSLATPEEVRNMSPEQYTDYYLGFKPKLRELRSAAEAADKLSRYKYSRDLKYKKELALIDKASALELGKLKLQNAQEIAKAKLTSGLKPADINSMAKMVGDMLPGTYNSVDNEFVQGVGDAEKAQAVLTRAEELRMTGMGAAAAVTKAGEEYGVKMPATEFEIQSFIDEVEAKSPLANQQPQKPIEEPPSKNDLGVGVGKGVAALGSSVSDSLSGVTKKVSKWGAKKRGRFDLGGKLYRAKGMKKRGNIDPADRLVAENNDGSISTEASISIGTDKGEVLIPTVIDGKRVSEKDAIEHYKRTGEHLGIFRTVEDANRYAKKLSELQSKRYQK